MIKYKISINGFFDGLHAIKERIKELIGKLNNNEEDLDVLDEEFKELSNVLTILENKIEESIAKRDENSE